MEKGANTAPVNPMTKCALLLLALLLAGDAQAGGGFHAGAFSTEIVALPFLC